MQEASEALYQDIRDYVQGRIQYLELRDENAAAVMRIPVTDPRVSWDVSVPGIITLCADITGSDPEITLPVTFKSSAVYVDAVGGNDRGVDTFENAPIVALVDQFNCRHQIQIPLVGE